MSVPFSDRAYTANTDAYTAEFLRALAASGRVFFAEEANRVYVLGRFGPIRLAKFPKEAGETLVSAGIVQPATGDPKSARETLGQLVFENGPAFPRLAGVLSGPTVYLAQAGTVERATTPTRVNPDLTVTVYLPGPTPPAPDPTHPHLRAAWSGLQWASPTDYANWLGAVCAAVSRPALAACPLYLLDSPRKSSGKTTAARALALLLTGRAPKPLTFTGTQETLEKRLGIHVEHPGPFIVLFDNVAPKQGSDGLIRSQFLSTAVSSHVSYPHVMYKGPAPLFDPVFVLTANDGHVEQDLGDKVVRFGLTLPTGTLARHLLPHPEEYVAAHRLAILAEVFDVLSDVVLPPGHTAVPGLIRPLHTRFYDWEQVVLQSAAALGLHADFDPAGLPTTDTFLLELVELFDAAPAGLTASDLVHKATTQDMTRSAVHAAILAQPAKSVEKRAAWLAQHLHHYYLSRPVCLADGRGRVVEAPAGTFRFVREARCTT